MFTHVTSKRARRIEMASIEVSDYVNETPVKAGVVGVVRSAWNEIVRHHRERRAIAHISRLSPHLIKDMGFDPQRINAAAGTWDGIPSLWPDWHPKLPR
jgi:uncharacterized protein YjiS (DUF1127 family)